MADARACCSRFYRGRRRPQAACRLPPPGPSGRGRRPRRSSMATVVPPVAAVVARGPARHQHWAKPPPWTPAPLDVAGVTAAADDALVAGVEIVSYRFDAARGELLRGPGRRPRPVGRARRRVRRRAVGRRRSAQQVRDGRRETRRASRSRTGARASPPGRRPARRRAAGRGPPRRRAVVRHGTVPFDADLFRVRRVRVRLRLEADSDTVRGRSPARGARAGWARRLPRVGDVESRSTLRRRRCGGRRDPRGRAQGQAAAAARRTRRGPHQRRATRRRPRGDPRRGCWLVRARRLADVGGGARSRGGGGRGEAGLEIALGALARNRTSPPVGLAWRSALVAPTAWATPCGAIDVTALTG